MGTGNNTALQGYLCSPAPPLTPSSEMNKCSAAVNGAATPVRANAGLHPGPENCKNRRGPGHVMTHGQEPREHSIPTISTSDVTPGSHQRRWSADFCKCGTSPVITVRKNKKEPLPPLRGVSLLRPHAASRYSPKRYSCPPVGIFSSPAHSSSSSSSSSTSSCSSPPPVQTSVITGHDPRGWKLRPKSSSSSHRARTNRLSLQIPLPITAPDRESSLATNSQPVSAKPDPSPKPSLRPKPPGRRHSDSSAFLRSLVTPLPVVTLEELCTVHLSPLDLVDESDNVFSGGDEEEVMVTSRRRKVPPRVPEKTAMARQTAQLMALSHRRCGPVAANEAIIYSSVIKPKHSHQTEEHSSLEARITAELRLDTSCDRERSNPRFPG